jgi:hypothetical protein
MIQLEVFERNISVQLLRQHHEAFLGRDLLGTAITELAKSSIELRARILQITTGRKRHRLTDLCVGVGDDEKDVGNGDETIRSAVVMRRWWGWWRGMEVVMGFK